MKEQLTNCAEVWSAERIKELTMSRITAKSFAPARIRRPIAMLVACAALIFTMSVSAFAANAFGIRDLVGNFFGWNVDEAVGVLKLNTDDRTTVGIWGGDDSAYEMNLKSLTLSPTELTFSYTFKSDNGEPPLPAVLAVRMGDGATVDAAISDTSVEGDLLTGTASFPAHVNLDEAVAVLFAGPDGERFSVTMIIPVNSDVPWPDPLPTIHGEDENTLIIRTDELP